jgi:hypothetical protein
MEKRGCRSLELLLHKWQPTSLSLLLHAILLPSACLLARRLSPSSSHRAPPPLQLAPPLLPPWHLPPPSSSAHTAADHGAPPCELGFLPWRLSPGAVSSSLPLRFPWLRAPTWTPSSPAMEPYSSHLLPAVHVQEARLKEAPCLNDV